MKRIYKIYVPGFSKPGWVYKTNKAFYSRLRALANLHTLTSVTVYINDLDKWYLVNLNPSPDVAWSSVTMSQTPENMEV